MWKRQSLRERREGKGRQGDGYVQKGQDYTDVLRKREKGRDKEWGV